MTFEILIYFLFLWPVNTYWNGQWWMSQLNDLDNTGMEMWRKAKYEAKVKVDTLKLNIEFRGFSGKLHYEVRYENSVKNVQF